MVIKLMPSSEDNNDVFFSEEPKVQIEEEVYFSETTKRVRGNSVGKTGEKIINT